MKVKFIHYYFLLNINDVPAILEKLTPPPIPFTIYKYGKNYMVLHAIKKRLTIIYLDNILHVPLVGTKSGQVIV
jgi:hypothetical protein